MKYWGKDIVWAVHPKMPSDSVLSRGRKRHLAKSDKLTYCNMTNDGLFETYQSNNGMCKQCMMQFKLERGKTK